MSGEPKAARLNVRRADGGLLVVELDGDWLSAGNLPGLAPVEAEFAAGGLRALGFDTTGLGRWNSGIMTLVLKCGELCARDRVEFRPQTLPAGMARLIRLAQAVPERPDANRTAAPSPFLQRVGDSVLKAGAEGQGMLTFLGENVLAFRKLLRGRAQFRWPDALLVMQQSGPQALGIVALINFLIGLILAFVGATQLRTFGASLYVADLVGVASVREMSCIMTGIIMCGRTGAAFAAQLGTMKVNQEIEAFQTLGISPVEFLVLPRVVALVLMMPLLCIFADLIAIGGGFWSTAMLDVTPALYLHRTVAAIQLTAFLLGVFKGAFFGVLIALTGCLHGMQCGTNAAAVGQATTSAVVAGITAIIASDGLFAVLCHVLKV